MIRRPPRSTLFPTRRSSDLSRCTREVLPPPSDNGRVDPAFDLDRLGWLQFESGIHPRSEEHTSELQSHSDLVCRLLLEKKKKITTNQKKTNKNTQQEQDKQK